MKLLLGLTKTLVVFCLILSLTSCKPTPSQSNAQKASPDQPTHLSLKDSQGFLLLGQAQFVYQTDETGKKKPVPGPARLEIVHNQGSQWVSEVIEDSDSNVFHKVMTAEKLGYPDHLLSIGANSAFLKLWRKEKSGWQGQTLWNPVFGGKHNRLRDLEIDDVTGDGKPEIVIATHDQGVIGILQGEKFSWQATEYCRAPKTFVHEIEVGDVNGNGVNEIYTTPSAPNKMDGTPQPGKIVCLEFNGDTFKEHLVEEFPQRHVKEILVAQVTPQEKPYLFAALEAELTKGELGEIVVDPVKIKQYSYLKGRYQGQIIAELDDRQCRFLNVADLNNDGSLDLVASGYKSGLWLLEQPTQSAGLTLWKKTLIDPDSSGYEHATTILDLDQDGSPEIYVAADEQRSLTRYTWNGTSFDKTKLKSIKDDTITFGLMGGRL